MNIDKHTSGNINAYNGNTKVNTISKRISTIINQTALVVGATMVSIGCANETGKEAAEISPQIQSFNKLLELYNNTQTQLDDIKKPIAHFIAYYPEHTFHSRSTEVLLDTFSSIVYSIQIDDKIEDIEIKDAHIAILTRGFLNILEHSKKGMVDIQKIKEINNTLAKKNIPTNVTICVNNLEEINEVIITKCFKKVSIQNYRNILQNEELSYKKAQKYMHNI